MSNFPEWHHHPITKQVISDIEEALEETRLQSNLKDTVDQTAMQTAYSEGFCDGIAAFIECIDNMRLAEEAEKVNED